MATISQCCVGEPDLGPEIRPDKSKVTKRRALLGWNHSNDTLAALSKGQIWCWVTEGDHLQIFDQNYNRSKVPGNVRDCGVANFTMVRMFHPYWCKNGQVPRDMVWEDKKECRDRYKRLLGDRRVRNNLPVNDEVANPTQPEQSHAHSPERRQTRNPFRKPRFVRPIGRSTNHACSRSRRGIPRKPAVSVTGTVERLGGHDAAEPMYVTDSDIEGAASPISPTCRTRRSRPKNSVSRNLNIEGCALSTNKTDYLASNSNIEQTIPSFRSVQDILGMYEPPRARSFTTVDHDPFKRSLAPRYHPGMLKSAFKPDTEQRRNTALPQLTSPYKNSGATLSANSRRDSTPAIPTIESDMYDDKPEQDIKDDVAEDDEPLQKRQWPATTKLEVIVLDDD